MNEVSVSVRAPSGKIRPGSVRIQTWNKAARTRRALKFWIACWALAIVSVVFPIVHFVLVPGFFLAGPIGAYLLSQQSSQVLGGETACPECGRPLLLEKGPDRWPLADLCTGCQTAVTVEKVS